MILLSHPTGNEYVRATLAVFDRAGMLGEFWTTLSWNSRSQINRMLPRRVRALLERRSLPDSIRSRTSTFPFRESVRLLTGVCSVDAVLRHLALTVPDHLRKTAP